jgi:hypothetical protein
MSLVLIHTQVLTLEDVMETAPSLMDLTSEDLDYQDVDDRGAMMVEDSKDEQKNIPPPVLPHQDTPHPAPVVVAVEVVDVDAEGEDDAWYIPPVFHCHIHPLDEYSTAHVDLLPGYMADAREDPLASPH